MNRQEQAESFRRQGFSVQSSRWLKEFDIPAGEYRLVVGPDECILVEPIKPVELILNEDQRAAVSWHFDPNNRDGEPWPLDEPVEIQVDRGQLVLNGTYLHSNGEWATFHEEDRE